MEALDPPDSQASSRLDLARPPTPLVSGAAGAAGEKGICPRYCAADGGVFFEGTRL